MGKLHGRIHVEALSRALVDAIDHALDLGTKLCRLFGKLRAVGVKACALHGEEYGKQRELNRLIQLERAVLLQGIGKRLPQSSRAECVYRTARDLLRRLGGSDLQYLLDKACHLIRGTVRLKQVVGNGGVKDARGVYLAGVDEGSLRRVLGIDRVQRALDVVRDDSPLLDQRHERLVGSLVIKPEECICRRHPKRAA